MRILAIDTAGPVIGVALATPSGLFVRRDRVQRGAEALLVPWVMALCAEARLRARDLDGIAVAAGPGAFTGIRVGLATAAGLAHAIGCPLWAGSSLDARAGRHGGEVLAMLDARKGRVYAGSYNGGVRTRGPADVSPAEALSWPVGPFLATGEGALVYADQVALAGGTVAAEADDPAVDVLARLGAEAIARGEGGDALVVSPVYLRDADARPPTRGPR